MQHFTDELAAAVASRRAPVCVGLDPRWEQLPAALKQAPVGGSKLWVAEHAGFSQRATAYLAFCRGIIDVVAPLVPAVKPQAAFFEELGPPGMAALKEVILYAQDHGLLVILDAKRGDIGSTAEAYARGMLGRGGQSAWSADALTVNPYLGQDSLEPFVETAKARAAGLFVLVKTSNPGGAMLQDLPAQGRPIYRHVAELVERLAEETAGTSGYGVVGAVAGATYPQQLAELREAMPHAWLLVPGYGSQGGAAADAAAAFDERGLGAIVNNSRGIIFAHSRTEYAERFGDARWQDAVAAATTAMIDDLRSETPAGKLAPIT